MNKCCKQCLYFDQCISNKVCENYTPLGDSEDIDKIIEAKRAEFHKEWFKYIEVIYF